MPRKVLFVCTVNRMRSATAHRIYENDGRFEVDSAGTDPKAEVVLTRDLLEWSDCVVVMEPEHRKKIRNKFPDMYASKKIVCLYIPDEFHYMQPELIEILQVRFEDAYRRGLLGR